MEKVRAKFQCGSIVPGFAEGSKSISLYAVYSSEGENADYAKATPSGNLQIYIDASTPAVNFFEQGKEYYLDFTKVE